jgi:uncharacterized protein (UPF0548 family)
MRIGGLYLGALSANTRGQLLRGARETVPTYAHIGSTLDPEQHDAAGLRTRHLEIGHGRAAFAAAAQALRTWVPRLAIGADIEPPDQPVVHGATMLVILRRGPVTVVAPNRIVGVIDEPRRFAFAYGTLPGHPERGEESFTVEHLPDDTVRATIRVQAGPGTCWARAAAPVVRRLQLAALRRYLDAIADFVTSATEPSSIEKREP